jgi:hypothetical protein
MDKLLKSQYTSVWIPLLYESKVQKQFIGYTIATDSSAQQRSWWEQ